MSEKFYEFLLKLYPDHFRKTWGDEALRLVRERARSEKGFLSGLRLWLDLFLDLALSVPREYRRTPKTAIVAAQPLHAEPSFQLLTERSLNPALLFLACTLSAALLWACVTSVARSRTFPAVFRDSLSLQALVQSNLDLARSRPREESDIHAVPVAAYSFCMTAHLDIPGNSMQPLFVFNFPPPGASGSALIDGKVARIFKNEQRLSIRAHLLAGDHQLVLHLERPAEATIISSNNAFEYCQPK